jgi:tRNA(Ile)-lysidine synthase
MDALAPFEPRPHLAVAVSGGADSLALAFLADAWARSRGGVVTALTVDHRLRPESAAEARRVGRWLGARRIAHRVLRWDGDGPVPRRALQARARMARYRLLEAWCARAGVLHLMIAHHRDDQAETFLLRLGQGSGLMGLAAMAAVRELDSVRLLRPLLGMSRAGLEAVLVAEGQDWVHDPSNLDTAYARVRLRALMPELAAEGLDVPHMADLAGRFAAVRAALDGRMAARLAHAALPHPAGFVRLDRAVLAACGPWEGERVLARALGAVGGGGYPPRGERLERLYRNVTADAFRGRTLAGCRVLPGSGGSDLLVCREAAAAAPPVPAASGLNRWDGRFVLRLTLARRRARGGGAQGLRIGALGRTGWATARRDRPECVATAAARAIPASARAVLPAVFDRRGLLAVPHLGYRRSGRGTATLLDAECRPLVAETLAGPRFFGTPHGL